MSDVTPIALDLDLGELESEADGEEAAPKSKGLGLIPMVAAAVVAAGVAGGAAFVLTPGAKEVNPACIDPAESGGEAHGDDHEADASHGEDHDGETSDHGDDAASLEECVAEDHDNKKEEKKKKKKADKGTDDEGAEILLDNGFYVQDVLNTYLRSVDHTVLEDPSSMSHLRAQILRRIRVIVPDASVTNVLITEFILT